MSPPEVWGPAVWFLFHTLIEKMNPDAYPYIIGSMFGIIVRICKLLPCPDCSKDASNFLAKINLKDYKTKNEFKNMMYLFHNWVNAKKRKPLFNYANMNIYETIHLPFVINNFIAKYNTKGNMKLLAESFQRSFVVKDFISWFKYNSQVFIRPPILEIPKNTNQPVENIPEEKIIQNTDVEEPLSIEDAVVEEKIDSDVEEPIHTDVEEKMDANIEENVDIEESIANVEEKMDANIEENVDIEESISNVEDVSIKQDTNEDDTVIKTDIPTDENEEKNLQPNTIEETIVIQNPKKKRNKSKK
jgi:hypothetical protein